MQLHFSFLALTLAMVFVNTFTVVDAWKALNEKQKNIRATQMVGNDNEGSDGVTIQVLCGITSMRRMWFKNLSYLHEGLTVVLPEPLNSGERSTFAAMIPATNKDGGLPANWHRMDSNNYIEPFKVPDVRV
ncbi:hypothetical protein K438DRAFT_1783016 [Mycena galopus ATCC 62051]|nr:hypothetical protein K438DRAFT_1783016 [Mycena galopus ATCC 62051]